MNPVLLKHIRRELLRQTQHIAVVYLIGELPCLYLNHGAGILRVADDALPGLFEGGLGVGAVFLFHFEVDDFALLLLEFGGAGDEFVLDEDTVTDEQFLQLLFRTMI